MHHEIVQMHGDLKREVWRFSLFVSWINDSHIYFDSYLFQTRDSARKRKWDTEGVWNRLNKQYDNIKDPPLPSDVESQMREYFANAVRGLEIKR